MTKDLELRIPNQAVRPNTGVKEMGLFPKRPDGSLYAGLLRRRMVLHPEARRQSSAVDSAG